MNSSKVISIILKVSAFIVMLILVAIIGYVMILGIPELKLSLFQWKYTSDNVSMLPSIINTILMVVFSLLIAVPLGLGAAIFLTQYKREGKIVKLIRMTSETLSGIPSIVYGLSEIYSSPLSVALVIPFFPVPLQCLSWFCLLF